MGQQQTVTAATEERGGGTLRRVVLALLVAALMAVMMATSAMPAMAAVFPENPKGKPIQAGDTFNDRPGRGPAGTGSVGATVGLCPGSNGAEVFNVNKDVRNCR